MGQILAIDFGLKRCGIAVTDPMQLIASGLTTVQTHKLEDFLKEYVSKEKVVGFVIGKPYQMNFQDSESEPYIASFLERLSHLFPQIALTRVDERFTSKMAKQSLIDSGAKKKHRKQKEAIDEISATLILQSYLDQQKTPLK